MVQPELNAESYNHDYRSTTEPRSQFFNVVNVDKMGEPGDEAILL